MKLNDDYILSLINEDKRFDGRKIEEFRDIVIEKGVIENAEGSARVKIGETEVIAGVKLDTMEPYPDAQDEGTLMVSAEFSPLASPDFETGAPREDSIELARVVDRGIREAGAIDVKKLCIKKGEKVWVVSIDIQIVNHSGNLIDAASLASVAAIMDAKYPVIDKNGKIDYKKKTNKSLPIVFKPIAVTVNRIGGKLILDANLDEEAVTDTKLLVTTKDNGNICALQKMGTGPLSLEEIANAFELSVKKGKEIRKLL